MNCNEVTDLIQLYLDDELDARSTLSVQQHLESCSVCSRLLNSFLEQDRLLRDEAQAVKVFSEPVRARILGAIRAEPRERRGWTIPAIWVSNRSLARAAAVIAVAALVGLLLKYGVLPGISGSVHAAVASDHAGHCSFDARAGAITERDDLDRLSRTYGNLSRTPDLSSFGFSLPAGRVCKVDGSTFLHLVYYDADQRALSVFLRPHSKGPITEGLTELREHGWVVVSVLRAGLDLLVVTSPEEARGAVIADVIAGQLSGRLAALR